MSRVESAPPWIPVGPWIRVAMTLSHSGDRGWGLPRTAMSPNSVSLAGVPWHSSDGATYGLRWSDLTAGKDLQRFTLTLKQGS